MLEKLMRNTETMTAWVPWAHGIEFELAYVGRPELDGLVRSNTKTRFVKGRQVDQLDEEAFSLALVKRAIRGWRGMRLGALSRVLPIDLDGQSPDDEVTFSAEDMAIIANHAYGFAEWLNRQLTDLDTFRAAKLEAEVKN